MCVHGLRVGTLRSQETVGSSQARVNRWVLRPPTVSAGIDPSGRTILDRQTDYSRLGLEQLLGLVMLSHPDNLLV